MNTREFSLKSILSIVTGYVISDDFHEIIKFIVGEIHTNEILYAIDHCRVHVLEQIPALGDRRIYHSFHEIVSQRSHNLGQSIDEWIKSLTDGSAGLVLDKSYVLTVPA